MTSAVSSGVDCAQPLTNEQRKLIIYDAYDGYLLVNSNISQPLFPRSNVFHLTTFLIIPLKTGLSRVSRALLLESRIAVEIFIHCMSYFTALSTFATRFQSPLL